MSNVIKYLGDGSQFLAGVPARDLTEQEYQALSDELRKVVLESNLYDFSVPTPKLKPASNKETDHA